MSPKTENRRRDGTITGRTATRAGKARTTSTPAPSFASSETWPEEQFTVPSDDATQDSVAMTGANASTAPVVSAAKRTTRLHVRGETVMTNRETLIGLSIAEGQPTSIPNVWLVRNGARPEPTGAGNDCAPNDGAMPKSATPAHRGPRSQNGRMETTTRWPVRP